MVKKFIIYILDIVKKQYNFYFGKKMNKCLDKNDFINIAKNFGLNPAHIYAIFKIEAGGKSGFLLEDKSIPVTLYEGHIFYREMAKRGFNVEKISNENPTICYKHWTKKFYKRGLEEYYRYILAKEINEECANLSTSWGLGQIMGFNYKLCGYSDIFSFVKAMYGSEYNQLIAMCKFISSNKKMYNALLDEDWNTFARLYNGPQYKLNSYEKKLEEAYNKYK